MTTVAFNKTGLFWMVILECTERMPQDGISIKKWVNTHLLNAQRPQEAVEDQAESILKTAHFSTYANDSKRYQIAYPKASDKLLNLIFEGYWVHASVKEVEALPSIEHSAYPWYKKICCMEVPGKLAIFFNNIIAQTILTVIASYCSYRMGRNAYASLKRILQGRMLPFVIHHTPMMVIDASHRILNAVHKVLQYKLYLLVDSFSVKQCILGASYILDLNVMMRANTIRNIGNFFYVPQRRVGFLMTIAWDGARFGVRTCTFLSSFFSSIEIKARQAYLDHYKSQWLVLWQQALREQIPSRA